MATFPFTLITPEGKLFQGEVVSVTAPGELGDFGVLSKHAPMVSALKTGVLEVKSADQKLFWAVDSGVFEVNKDGRSVAIIDHALPAQSHQEAKENLSRLK